MYFSNQTASQDCPEAVGGAEEAIVKLKIVVLVDQEVSNFVFGYLMCKQSRQHHKRIMGRI